MCWETQLLESACKTDYMPVELYCYDGTDYILNLRGFINIQSQTKKPLPYQPGLFSLGRFQVRAQILLSIPVDVNARISQKWKAGLHRPLSECCIFDASDFVKNIRYILRPPFLKPSFA